MEIKPIGENVLLAENKKSTTTAGGIIIESENLNVSKSATVVAIGDKVTVVSVGDVIYPDWSKGFPIIDTGVQRVVLPQEAVLAVVTQ